MPEDKVFHSNSMVRIDGDKIRLLRENRGLTQLYIATVVGVTTDTISRWENRRYPSIKHDNAVKLAEALEAELTEILETRDQESEATLSADESSLPDAISEKYKSGKRHGGKIIALVFAVLLAVFAWWFYDGKETASVEAYRLLPPHIPAGEVFPVVINIRSEGNAVSLIIRETLPAGCVPVKAAPLFTNVDRKSGVLKWISRGGGQRKTFVYLARSSPEAGKGEPQRFAGTVTLGKWGDRASEIKGLTSMSIADFHWADSNGDGRIIDEEILAVYDDFTALDELDYDWNRIDDIWSGQGYQWDAAAKSFVIFE